MSDFKMMSNDFNSFIIIDSLLPFAMQNSYLSQQNLKIILRVAFQGHLFDQNYHYQSRFCLIEAK